MAMMEGTAEEEKRRICQQVCRSRCCRYITVVLPPPRRKWDFDELSWFLSHENISVYVEARRWHLEVRNPCKHLTSDNLCAIYERRPQVCRDYDHDSCEYPERPRHKLHFDTREEFDSWVEKRREERRLRRQARKERRAMEGAQVQPAALVERESKAA
jgi:hypothetical protein